MYMYIILEMLSYLWIMPKLFRYLYSTNLRILHVNYIKFVCLCFIYSKLLYFKSILNVVIVFFVLKDLVNLKT